MRISSENKGDHRMAEAQQEKNEIETPIKGPASRFSESGNKQSVNRMANKLRNKESAQTQSQAVAHERVADSPRTLFA
jgi:hypothetical protein